MKRRSVGWALVACLATCSMHAAAAEEAPPPPDPTAQHAVSVGASAGWMWLKSTDTQVPFDAAGLIQIEPSYRVSRALSVGALGSYGSTDPGLRIWRFAGEARYHAVRTRGFDLWGAGEGGFFVTRFEPALEVCCAVPGGTPIQFATAQPARAAPLVGAGFGFDLAPVPYASVGLEARALVGAFGNAEGGEPAGLSQAFTVAATLALHLPLGG